MHNAHLTTFFSHLQIITYIFFRVRECLVVLHSKVFINCFSIQEILLWVILLTNIHSLCSQQGLYKMTHSRNCFVNKYSLTRWLEVPSFQRHIWMNMERPTRWPIFFWKWNNGISRKIICKTISLFGWIWRKRFPLISFSSITSLIHVPPITLFICLTDVNQIESFECRTYYHLNHFVMF